MKIKEHTVTLPLLDYKELLVNEGLKGRVNMVLKEYITTVINKFGYNGNPYLDILKEVCENNNITLIMSKQADTTKVEIEIKNL